MGVMVGEAVGSATTSGDMEAETTEITAGDRRARGDATTIPVPKTKEGTLRHHEEEERQGTKEDASIQVRKAVHPTAGKVPAPARPHGEMGETEEMVGRARTQAIPRAKETMAAEVQGMRIRMQGTGLAGQRREDSGIHSTSTFAMLQLPWIREGTRSFSTSQLRMPHSPVRLRTGTQPKWNG